MKEEKGNIIRAITTPLGFFALSLLIVEAFLGTTLVFSKGNQDTNFCFWGMIIGAVLFIVVVFGVWLLVWKKPENIVFAGKDYLAKKREEGKIKNNAVKYQEFDKSATNKNNEKIQGGDEEPSKEEMDAAADAWISNLIDQERGK